MALQSRLRPQQPLPRARVKCQAIERLLSRAACGCRSRIIDKPGPERQQRLSILPNEVAAQFLKQIVTGRWSRRDSLFGDVNGNEDEHVRFRRVTRWTRLTTRGVIHRGRIVNEGFMAASDGHRARGSIAEHSLRGHQRRRDRARWCFAGPVGGRCLRSIPAF